MGRTKKIPDSPELDARIRAAHRERGAPQRLAAELGISVFRVYRRAAELGIGKARDVHREWSADELRIYRKYRARGVARICSELQLAGCRRSVAAVAMKLEDDALASGRLDILSLEQLAIGMGVDEATINQWINVYGLPAKRSKAAGATIHRNSLRLWLLNHKPLIDLRRVNRSWFIGICLGPEDDSD